MSFVLLQSGAMTVLMAVPTMYHYLLSHYDAHMTQQQQEAAAAGAGRLRLAVCGSAAAPVSLLQRWQALSGQLLLERYGMTETGMILSNPYQVRPVKRMWGRLEAANQQPYHNGHDLADRPSFICLL